MFAILRDAAKIVALALAAIIAVVLIVTNAPLAIITFATVVTVPVIVGQLIPIQPFFFAMVPAVHQSLVAELLPGLVPRPYPQGVLFRAEVRGLSWLLIPPLYSMLLAVIVVTGVWEHWNWNPSAWRVPILALWYFWAVATGFAAWRSWTWLAERLLLRKGAIALGVVENPGGEPNFGYWFFNARGERCGGIAPHFHWHKLTSPLTPVFVNSGAAELNKPGFAFALRRFVIVDARHLPAFLAEQKKRLQDQGKEGS